MVDEPDAFPSECLQHCLGVQPPGVRGDLIVRRLCVGMMWKRLITVKPCDTVAAAQLEGVNRDGGRQVWGHGALRDGPPGTRVINAWF